jgi:Ca2+-binding EF-hand superfamily protein
MKKTDWAIGLAVVSSLAVCGVAYAAHHEKGPTTRAEAQTHAAEMFAKLDGNKDGKLDPADRGAHMGTMFDKLDTDKDGKISREEFAAHHAGSGMKDGAGHGDKSHRMGMGGGHGRGGKMVHAMAAMADTNKDGAVSQAEFSAAALGHFDKADTDKNGTLTPEERRAAHQQMREHMRGMHKGDGHKGGDHDAKPAGA